MNLENKKNRIDELIITLNKASAAYYDEASEIMSNYEYDALYDELEALERETGYTPNDSPTRNVGYTVQSELPKEDMQAACSVWTRLRAVMSWLRGWASTRACSRGSLMG